jgi:hypothetical protein
VIVMRLRALGAVLVLAAAATACGRAGPGALLAPRQDPYQPPKKIVKRECARLEPAKRASGDPLTPAYDKGYKCSRWKTRMVGYEEEVEAPVHEPGAGPAPFFALVPSAAVGRRVSASGHDADGAYWIDAQLSLAFTPRQDRAVPFVAVGIQKLGGQPDLSGLTGSAGLMLAFTSSFLVEGHGRLVRSEGNALGGGGSLRYRPRHWTSHDWTVHLGIEHVTGDDQLPPDPPFDPIPNHATAVMLGATYGFVR